ncbi:hypothetical protein L0337_14085 [candidate division KSB1 bacterium]|nr:hypothetical protein [candidate division KSB1 bacterium]
MEWFEVKDGKIRRRWGTRDAASQAKQLGWDMPATKADVKASNIRRLDNRTSQQGYYEPRQRSQGLANQNGQARQETHELN